MEQGVTFLNEPHNVPLPYEINNTYESKKMSINDYTSTLENTNNSSKCNNEHCISTKSNTPHNKNMLNMLNMLNSDKEEINNDLYEPSVVMMSQCRDMHMHIKKCVYCRKALNREKYMLYLLLIIAILLFILIAIIILKKIV